jgi:hypothetical protein
MTNFKVFFLIRLWNVGAKPEPKLSFGMDQKVESGVQNFGMLRLVQVLEQKPSNYALGILNLMGVYEEDSGFLLN